MKGLRKYIFVVLLFAINAGTAQSFTAKVSAKIIGKNDAVQVDYVAENVKVQEFRMPRFKNWRIVSGPTTSSETSIINSTVRQRMTYSFVLQPSALGTLVVPPAVATINNRLVQTNGFNVAVKNVAHIRGSAPAAKAPSILDQLPFKRQIPSTQYLKKGESAIDKIKGNILVKLDVNKRSCYVGEPIIATYKLCSRLQSSSKVVKQPAFSGCTVIELTDDKPDQHVEKVNGTDYNVQTIRQVQLVPLAAGKLVLPPTSVENTVSFYTSPKVNYRDLYYGSPSTPVEEQVVTLANAPVAVDVKPLPPFPGAGNTEFSGAVGTFNISLAAGENVYTTNNTNHLNFTIQGIGNLQEVKMPKVKFPNGIEAFEPAEKEVTDKDNFPIRTAKLFSIPFVVSAKGSYVIPPIAFVYFDPNANKYATKTTPGFLIKVVQGNKSIITKAPDPNGVESFDEMLYIISGAGILAVIIGLVWYKNGRKAKAKTDSKVTELIPASEPAAEAFGQDHLYKIRELQPQQDNSTFYKQLGQNLQSYIRTRLKTEPALLPVYIEEHRQQAVLLYKLKELLDNCTLGMYTPVSMEQATEDRLAAIDTLYKLDKELGFRVF